MRLWSGAREAFWFRQDGKTWSSSPAFRIFSYSILSSVLPCLFADHLPIGVILARVRSDIGQDGHLVDVGIVLGVQSFEFRMQCFVAGAGQSGIAFTDLEEGISFMEVGVIVISR